MNSVTNRKAGLWEALLHVETLRLVQSSFPTLFVGYGLFPKRRHALVFFASRDTACLIHGAVAVRGAARQMWRAVVARAAVCLHRTRRI